MNSSITLFCEADSHQLSKVFTDKTINDLAKIRARISLGLVDLSQERAEIVAKLNSRGIPVVAWLLLPKEKGYWFCSRNAEDAYERYQHFKKWTSVNSLKWDGIGIDIEPDIRNREYDNPSITSFVLIFLKNMITGRKNIRDAQKRYDYLIKEMKNDDYLVESYLMPFVLDDRKVGSTTLQSLAGIINMHVDREVPMLYTSRFPMRTPAILKSYLHDATRLSNNTDTNGTAVAIGCTGGGINGDMHPLSREEFLRDLGLTSNHISHIYIFSLEGCINHQEDLITTLIDHNWSQPNFAHDASDERIVGLIRTMLQIFSRTCRILSISNSRSQI